jgi:hypothetical protein
MKSKVFRPFLDDVERLSYGKGAKKQRGTGSRFVCHRLNRDERKLFELAKKASFLTVRGTGYRKERKGSPLCNIFRQRCDALEEICVIVEKRSDLDTVVIDFSTLRVSDDTPFISLVLNNVLKAKYPDLYELVMKDKDGEGDSAASTVIPARINWEAVKTKPIWDVDDRVIAVSCDRGVAKSLAMDVLKESSNFMFDDIHNEEIIEDNRDEDADISSTTTADDDNIDWNDI